MKHAAHSQRCQSQSQRCHPVRLVVVVCYICLPEYYHYDLQEKLMMRLSLSVTEFSSGWENLDLFSTVYIFVLPACLQNCVNFGLSRTTFVTETTKASTSCYAIQSTALFTFLPVTLTSRFHRITTWSKYITVKFFSSILT